eukprot:1329026-Amphidinium_carterae.1
MFFKASELFILAYASVWALVSLDSLCAAASKSIVMQYVAIHVAPRTSSFVTMLLSEKVLNAYILNKLISSPSSPLLVAVFFSYCKDLAALFELTLSAVVFTVTYSCFSGAGMSLKHLL